MGCVWMEKVFVIGDIHGSFDLLEKLLTYWNPEEEQLVFLGDYIDRGPDSLKVLKKVIELSDQYDIVTLCGNHEQIFLNWLDKPEEVSQFYFNQKVGGIATVQSFLDVPDLNIASDNFSVKELTESIRKNNSDIIRFIKKLRSFYLWEPYLFVHAGIDANVENFRETKFDDYFWIREEFFSNPHLAKEIVVFGHTPTPLLNTDQSSDVWVSPDKKKIGIDGGGAIYEKGQLHGLVFSNNTKEIIIYSASRSDDVKTTSMVL